MARELLRGDRASRLDVAAFPQYSWEPRDRVADGEELVATPASSERYREDAEIGCDEPGEDEQEQCGRVRAQHRRPAIAFENSPLHASTVELVFVVDQRA